MHRTWPHRRGSCELRMARVSPNTDTRLVDLVYGAAEENAALAHLAFTAMGTVAITRAGIVAATTRPAGTHLA